ncbi:MAG: bifunctional diguanylate cyclase/phosphodiesterase [Acidimicrobiales bacterium]
MLGTYALVTAILVLLLGIALAASYRSAAEQRGVAEGRSEALLVAETAVEPLLNGRPLEQGLTPAEKADLTRLVQRAVRTKDVLRLRLRDLAGNVVFSDDGSGFKDRPDDEAIEAAHGATVAQLTHLNDDADDSGPVGPVVVEVYQPIYAGPSGERVGVLELYLPYAPIAADVDRELWTLYLDLALGLGGLYLLLCAIWFSMSRRLRSQVKVNKFLAEHDPLTDLPNRSLFQSCAQDAVDHARRTATHTALAIIDLDRFKEVNDTLGHHSGDEVLTKLAQRLADSTRPQDVVARLGGDEFGIVLRDVTDAEEGLRRLRTIIEHEVEVNGLPLTIESSVGFVVAPDDGIDVGELLQHADVAMYFAKAQHSGVSRYDSTQDHYEASNLELVGSLRSAIDGGQLVLHYQPKTGVDDGQVKAVEALVRWQHPTFGLMYPDSFIPLVEQTDLIDKLTEWVLKKALSDMRDLGPEWQDLSVSVNVSARSLNRSTFAGHVVEALRCEEMTPERLTIEITETALLIDPTRALAVLAEISGAGIAISIDDFGIGQTSLGYLALLPVDELKIDKSFVMDMLDNRAHAAIVRSIVELGHNLSFHVVAEGVETAEVLDALRGTGCDMAQGFYFARPMGMNDLRVWLSSTGRTMSAALEGVPAEP